jgi:DNA mismatch repair protein MutL
MPTDSASEQVLEKVLQSMACKAAVKAGDKLSDEEMTHLLANARLAPKSSNCPHGRPTTLKMSLAELEKQFKRT